MSRAEPPAGKDSGVWGGPIPQHRGIAGSKSAIRNSPIRTIPGYWRVSHSLPHLFRRFNDL
eukprot:15268367-Alexandrium_andersonii.AAC.1